MRNVRSPARSFILHPSSFILCALLLGCAREAPKIVVGSKNFTESVLLGEIVAQKLESAGCTVERRANMGGTIICDTALASGAIDAYVEYSGTALTAILRKSIQNDRTAVTRLVAAEYAKRGLQWGPDLGFNNSFAMIVRRADAERYTLHSIADLKRVEANFRPGFGYEFVERPDGWPGLIAAYGLTFAVAPATMDLGLTYKALASNQIDLIAGNSTDGLIDSLNLVALADDRRYFPPYDAAIARRADIDKKCRGAAAALAGLGGTIDDATMRRLNYEVDGKKRDVGDVAREFLNRKGGGSGSTS